MQFITYLHNYGAYRRIRKFRITGCVKYHAKSKNIGQTSLISTISAL